MRITCLQNQTSAEPDHVTGATGTTIAFLKKKVDIYVTKTFLANIW